MSARRRPRRLRHRLLVVPIAAVLLAGGAKLIATFAFGAAGAEAYDDGNYGWSETHYGRQAVFNVIHPWRAHVGIGDARYRQGDLRGAETAFTRALELDPGRCETRFNLAVTIEAQGDQALFGDDGAGGRPRPADAAERYSVALGVVEDADCPSRRPDDVGDRLAATSARILVKLAALVDAPTDDESLDPEQSDQSERGDSEQIDELKLRNESGASQREEARDRDTTGALPDGQSNW
jgi:hypothetical protein